MSPSGRSPCPGAGFPGALRACNYSLHPVCSLDSRVSGSRTGETGWRLLQQARKGGAEPLGGSRRVFPQVPTLGTGSWSRDGRRKQRASPAPESGTRLLLGKAAFLAGGVCRPLPLPPGPRARLEVSKGRRSGGSRRAGRWQGLWAVWVASRLLRDLTGIDGRDEGWRVSRVQAPVDLVWGTPFWWEKHPGTWELFSGTA